MKYMEMSYNKLRGRMAEKGYSMRKLSEISGISITTLSDKLNGRTEFKTSEIFNISNILDIENIAEYFFSPKVRNIEW